MEKKRVKADKATRLVCKVMSEILIISSSILLGSLVTQKVIDNQPTWAVISWFILLLIAGVIFGFIAESISDRKKFRQMLGFSK